MNNAYVFVVCGAAEHLETLQFSYEYLQLRTSFPIYVLTDQKRNEKRLDFPLLIDVQTPDTYSDHQAAIYLKTGLHRFLPIGKRYAYLDTDILAIGKHVDQVFDEYQQPITFAPDHCLVEDFSAYAVNCGCLQNWQADWDQYHDAYSTLDKNKSLNLSKRALIDKNTLSEFFIELQNNPILRIRFGIQYLLSKRFFRPKRTFYFDKKQRCWYNQLGETILYETPNKAIALKAGLKYNSLFRTWKTATGKPLWEAKCSHLNAALQDKFSLTTIPANWQHWNGGFFIFDDQSKAFLDRWHEWSIALFTDPKFKTRDQGTLIATVWSLGLQQHPTLHAKWNFLLDYHATHIRFDENSNQFSVKNSPFFSPEFVHVYHHWKDNDWQLWQWLEKQKIPQ